MTIDKVSAATHASCTDGVAPPTVAYLIDQIEILRDSIRSAAECGNDEGLNGERNGALDAYAVVLNLLAPWSDCRLERKPSP